MQTHRHLYLGIPILHLQRGNTILGDQVFQIVDRQGERSWIQRWMDWVGSIMRRMYARLLR